MVIALAGSNKPPSMSSSTAAQSFETSSACFADLPITMTVRTTYLVYQRSYSTREEDGILERDYIT